MATELLKLIPSIFWFFFFVVLLVLFYRLIRDALLLNLSAFKAIGLQLSFVKDSIDSALELAEKSPQRKFEVSSKSKEQALRRANKHLQIFPNAQFLWVDDLPKNNLNDRVMICQLKAEIDTAKSTEDVLDILQNGCYDLVISDIAHGDERTAGIKFLKQFHKVYETTLVLFYVGMFDPEKVIPLQAFGIANRLYELFHLILNALE